MPTAYPDLREEYRNVEAALTEFSIVVRGGDSFHRPGPDGETPACSSASGDWLVARTDNAVRLGMAPCRNCYTAALDYLATEVDDSPVERREEGEAVDSTDTVDGDLVVADGGGGLAKASPRIAAKPEAVLVASGSNTYHAPTANGPLCDQHGSFRRADREALAGHRDPCKECFAVEAIDTDSP
jgi:hypothetical protein